MRWPPFAGYHDGKLHQGKRHDEKKNDVLLAKKQ
jgi:hypothetical protein